MNCKYCGAGLPTNKGICQNCGRMIPISQQKEMREMLDPRWNQYRNKDTAMYKNESNTDSDVKTGKAIAIIIAIIVVIILISIIKGIG